MLICVINYYLNSTRVIIENIRILPPNRSDQWEGRMIMCSTVFRCRHWSLNAKRERQGRQNKM